MRFTKYIGRVGTLAVALGVGMSLTGAPGAAEAADSTALLVCGTTCPKFDPASVDLIMDQFITPTHPGVTITPVAVTTPEEYWPITGFLRLVELAIGDPRLGGLGGPAWPDEPWWKLSGLFDLTINQSIEAGASDLETAMAEYGNDHLVIYGYSQGAAVVVTVKRKLAEQYPEGTQAPNISFVLGGDTNLPNGGLNARFPGLYIPILDLTFNGPEPTDTPFRTDVITRQYDGAADFPLYPLNIVADVNAVLGFLFLHTYPFDVSLAGGASAPIVSTDPSGKNTYYFFETHDLPLFAPLRMLGVPEPLIDVVEPFFRAIVELGYDRSIPPWEPTPARLIPPLDPGRVITDLVDAVGEGLDNAQTLVVAPPPPSSPVPTALAARQDEAVQTEEVQTEDVQTEDVRTEVVQTEDVRTEVVPVASKNTPTEPVTTDASTEHPRETTEATSTSASTAESPTSTTDEPATRASAPEPPKPASAESASGASSSAASTSGSSSAGDSSGGGDGDDAD